MAMISPALKATDQIEPFLEAHIQRDLHQIAECYKQSTDNCILLLHNLINRMKQSKYFWK